MHTLSPSESAPPVAAADHAQARLQRIGQGAGQGAGQAGGRGIGNAPSRSDPARHRRHGSGHRGFRLGWTGWLLVQAGLVVLALAATTAWPAVTACRAQEARTGFYAGDTLGKCIRRGIGERLDRADQRVKMFMRGSGA